MNRRFHGLLSLSLVFGAVTVGIVSVFLDSMILGLFYGVLILVSLPVLMYAFCAKCPCREAGCGHVLPPKLTRVLPSRKQGSYTSLDLAGVLGPFVILFGFPQWWLWGNPALLGIFWAMVLVAFVEIRLFVCRGCGNSKCPMCPELR